jgi:murein DD-endopeptidase MepM/ murein hydrolase activator NlpD
MEKNWKNFLKPWFKTCRTSGKRLGWRQKGILIALAVTMIVGYPYLHSFATEIDQAKEEKSNLEKKKQETELRLAELEKEKGDILNYIEKLDKELENLAGEVYNLNKDIEATNKDLKVAKEELALAKLTEENQYSTMKKRIQYMYENGQTDYFELILKADNLSEMLNQIEYMSKITQYDNNLLGEYTALKQDVINKEQKLEAKIEELNGLKEELTYEQDTITRLVKDKNAEVVKYEASIDETESLSAEYDSKLAEQEQVIEDLLEAERRRIEEEERRKEEERKRQEEERKRQKEERKKQEQEKNNQGQEQNGGDNTSTEEPSNEEPADNSDNASTSFTWPVPASKRITSYFGNRNQPTAGASTYHKGIDIGASTGTEIVAASSGTVVTAAYSGSAGNYVMISHGNSTYTVYMHCSKLLVSVGQQVSRGETIALVGSTGVSTGPHLHFGVSVNGSYVNPLNYVSN